eukprot:gene11661-biopygen8215
MWVSPAGTDQAEVAAMNRLVAHICRAVTVNLRSVGERTACSGGIILCTHRQTGSLVPYGGRARGHMLPCGPVPMHPDPDPDPDPGQGKGAGEAQQAVPTTSPTPPPMGVTVMNPSAFMQ